MSFFNKFFKKSSKSKDAKRKDSSQGAEEELKIPQLESGGRKDRNLSISRSGRHKLKGKQRASVLQDDMYRQGQVDGAPDAPHGGRTSNNSNNTIKDVTNTSSSYGQSQAMQSQTARV